jgi:bacterioferritin-associated ferredoxin
MGGAHASRLVCRCRGLSDRAVHELARLRAAGSVAELAATCGAGAECETCHPELEEILARVQGRPVERECRLANRRTCARETRARLLAWLEQRAQPILDSLGASLDAVEIEGLTVRLWIGGGARREALRAVAECLRAEICPDLEVEPLGTRG